jgi:hypothetical protein
MRVVKIFFGLVCFGSGVAFAMDAVNALVHVGYAEKNMVSHSPPCLVPCAHVTR